MPIYEYKALNASGQSKTGILDADSPREARGKLRKDGVHVTSIRVLKDVNKATQPGTKSERSSFSFDLKLPQRKETAAQLSQFTRQFSTLLRAGTPLAETLQVLIEQVPSRRFEATLRDVRERVTGGDGLGDAMTHHPTAFNELYVNMVRAGEASGHLDVVLERIGDYLQKQARLRNKIVSALTYPMIMVAVGVLVVTVLMNFVVPRILALVSSKGGELPLPTQILRNVSEFFQQTWGFMAVGIVAAVLIVRAIGKTEKGRYSIDRFKLGVPIVGDLFKKQAISRFAVTLATLLKSGVPVLEALKIVQNVVNNAVMAEIVGIIHDRIVEGTDISTPLKKSKLFPPVVGHMIAVGEQSGQLEDILGQLAEAYDDEIDVATQRMTSILEPVMILVIAVIVAFIVLAIVLPMLRLGKMGK